MKILKLDQTSLDPAATFTERRGALQAIHHELAPGQFLHITLGAAGVQIFSGSAAVAIPLAELVRVATEHEPALAEKKAPAKK